MLRLNPTQIRLDARDRTWHIDRHNERLTLRNTGPPTTLTNKIKSPKKHQQKSYTHDSPYYFFHPSVARQREVDGKPEDSLTSNEPIPHDSRSFWDRVLADAGTPTRTQKIAHGNATLIEPSAELLGTNRSSRASFEEGHSDCQDDIGDEALDSDDSQSHFRNAEARGSSQWPLTYSSGSIDSTKMDPSVNTDKADEEQNLLPEKSVKTAPGKRRLSFNNFNFLRRKVTPDLDGSTEAKQHPSSSRRTIDGRHESRWIYDRSRLESANSSPEGDVNDGMYGNRRDRRTISASLESLLPAPPSESQLEHIPRHAGGLPRSSLYISEAATSSSPHRDPATTMGHSEVSASEGLLGLPPRRRKRYKPRSESYPFVSSEDIEMSDPPQLDGPSTTQSGPIGLPALTVSHPSTHDMVPAPSTGIPAWSYQPPGASPASTPRHEGYTVGGLHGQAQTSYEWSSPHESQQDSVEISSYRSRSSMGSHHARIASSHSQIGPAGPSPSRRNLSPYAEAFIPRSARRHPSPQLSLPPPFSATPRNLSSASVFPPSSSSFSPHTPSSRLSSYSLSHVPHSHAHHVPVYNDSLPPTTQPQTPAELSRNRRPQLATQNPFNTAPARPPGLAIRDGRLADWQAFGTPTRGPSIRTRTFINHEQENVGAVDAEERQLRREAARGIRMGTEELERETARGIRMGTEEMERDIARGIRIDEEALDREIVERIRRGREEMEREEMERDA